MGIVRINAGCLIGAIGFGVFILSGCTDMKYTVHIDKSLENTKVTQSTIAVFPIDDLRYQPPSGCMGPPSFSSGDQAKYQTTWNEKVHSSLVEKFPSQKFVFLSRDEGVLGQGGGVDLYSILSLSEEVTRAVLINAMKSDSISFETGAVSSKMQGYLKNLTAATGAQYAIVFISPSLSGETQTYWSSGDAGGGYFGYNYGGFTPTYTPTPMPRTQTYYTANVKTLVWECSTGKLLFSSGGWSKNSSPCFFITPESMAISGANSKFESNLQKIISRLVEYNASIRFADGAK